MTIWNIRLLSGGCRHNTVVLKPTNTLPASLHRAPQWGVLLMYFVSTWIELMTIHIPLSADGLHHGYRTLPLATG